MKIVVQVKKYRNSLPVPEISKTPGQFEGAKFCFKKVLELRLEEEVSHVPADNAAHLMWN